jgi:LacI family transcriptional regulator
MKSEDIARLAGVSRSTVSRVINNYANVPEATRRKVMAVIENYHYAPNSSARVLAGKGSNTLGLFIVSIADKFSPNRIYQNNYFATFVDTVIDTANASGYYVLVHTIYSEKDYQRVKQAFLEKRVDSGIIVGTQRDTGIIRDIIRLGNPLAIIDFDPKDLPKEVEDHHNVALVNSMDYQGLAMALEYLVGLGHREIGFIAGRLDTYSGRERKRAFIETGRRLGLEIKEEYILQGEFLKIPTYQSVKRLIKTGLLPTAILASNDSMALTALDALKEAEFHVPDDVSLIGFDDIPIAAQVQPALTTVKLPIHDMARKAAEYVIAVTEETKVADGIYEFPTELVIRDSCAPLR